ncbi:MAG: hypothetical protein COY58_04330 [Gammaproteobacteria bacterium CG_4_10_14_0_8_um_filter_38_16]|nr:MAG: hypothetical protein COY58_04330 [Gammaproteobacteria bacterium CG_4_10_14_0_8_um_filter_38_16]PJA02584.1 MAG: hypothetical protein COX72_09550 [Gammaproteobacteria bacterium CG_4_10_14_0_2_um_filter_38_22]PJB09972.1 MAG: hypothetical protein CO120_07215 [Gammaproteobacteria bacterium CG_4_9_14_3_um_filter_38_9]
MFKHILLLVILSVAAIFLQSELVHVLHFLMFIYRKITNGLGFVFSVDAAGETVQSVLTLLLIPIALAAIFAITHFFIRKSHFPHTMTVVWSAWAILLAAILSQNGHVPHTAQVAASRASTQQKLSAKMTAASQKDLAVQSQTQQAQQQQQQQPTQPA